MDGTSSAAPPSSLTEELSNLRVVVDDEGEPTLLRAEGTAVDTRREGYPYPERMTRAEDDVQERHLQVEPLELQDWVKESGEGLVVLFEGRDAAGGGGTIERVTEHLDPRGARVVALERPSERERTQWYFQRCVGHLPAAGGIVLFERSWYDRAGVERVMGFTSPRDHLEFMRQAPQLEAMRHVLHQIPCSDEDVEVVTPPDPLLVGSASEVFEDDSESGPLSPSL